MSRDQKVQLKYRFLGKSGLKVSELCLGTMLFGFGNANSHWGMPACDQKTSFAIMDAFFAVGGNFLDTANVYGAGDSESVIGLYIASKPDPEAFRERLVIATKVRFPVGPGPNTLGTSRKHILASVNASLKRMKTSYIDLLQLHGWDEGTPLEETFRTLNGLVDSGKIRYFGVSNFTAWQLQRAIDLCRENKWSHLISLQPQYHLLCRSTEWGLLPVCRREGVAVLPWSPLCGGWLSGRYKRGQKAPEENSRVGWADNFGWETTAFRTHDNEKTWKLLDEINLIASELKASAAQVSLRWLMQRQGIACIPIIGPRTMEHLYDNLAAANIQLSSDHMARLDKLSAIPIPYPYSNIDAANKRDKRYRDGEHREQQSKL